MRLLYILLKLLAIYTVVAVPLILWAGYNWNKLRQSWGEGEQQ